MEIYVPIKTVPLTIDELEDVVEDEVGSGLGHEVEGLRVAHGSLLLVHLPSAVSFRKS
jgi:hypothetical protein